MRHSTSCRSAALLLLAAILGSGCTAAREGYPDTSFDADAELKQLATYYDPATLKAHEALPVGTADQKNAKKLSRNKIVNGRLRAIDIHFSAFQKELYKEGVTLNVGTDWALLGLSGAGAVVGGASTKAILAAIAGGITGGKASFDKHVFFEKTMPVLLGQMVALRKQKLVTIRDGLQSPDSQYPLDQALVDVEAYYHAGTLPGAIIEIAEQAGTSAKQAEKQLRIVFQKRGEDYVTTVDTAKRLVGVVNTLTDAAVLEIVATPPVAISAETQQAIDTMDPNNLRESDAAMARRVLRYVVAVNKDNRNDIKKLEAAIDTAEKR